MQALVRSSNLRFDREVLEDVQRFSTVTAGGVGASRQSKRVRKHDKCVTPSLSTGSDAPQRSVTRAEYDAWWNTLTPQQQDAEMARWYAEVDGAPPPTGPCIDSDTQVMVPARPADAVFCGSCGR